MAFACPARSSSAPDGVMLDGSGLFDDTASHSSGTLKRRFTKPKRFQSAYLDQKRGAWSCRNCDWTYPDRQPSALQRREHKKHCQETLKVQHWLGEVPFRQDSTEEEAAHSRDDLNAAEESVSSEILNAAAKQNLEKPITDDDAGEGHSKMALTSDLYIRDFGTACDGGGKTYISPEREDPILGARRDDCHAPQVLDRKLERDENAFVENLHQNSKTEVVEDVKSPSHGEEMQSGQRGTATEGENLEAQEGIELVSDHGSQLYPEIVEGSDAIEQRLIADAGAQKEQLEVHDVKERELCLTVDEGALKDVKVTAKSHGEVMQPGQQDTAIEGENLEAQEGKELVSDYGSHPNLEIVEGSAEIEQSLTADDGAQREQLEIQDVKERERCLTVDEGALKGVQVMANVVEGVMEPSVATDDLTQEGRTANVAEVGGIDRNIAEPHQAEKDYLVQTDPISLAKNEKTATVVEGIDRTGIEVDQDEQEHPRTAAAKHLEHANAESIYVSGQDVDGLEAGQSRRQLLTLSSADRNWEDWEHVVRPPKDSEEKDGQGPSHDEEIGVTQNCCGLAAGRAQANMEAEVPGMELIGKVALTENPDRDQGRGVLQTPISSQQANGQTGGKLKKLSSADMNWEDWDDVIKSGYVLIKGRRLLAPKSVDDARLHFESHIIGSSGGESGDVSKLAEEEKGEFFGRENVVELQNKIAAPTLAVPIQPDDNAKGGLLLEDLQVPSVNGGIPKPKDIESPNHAVAVFGPSSEIPETKLLELDSNDLRKKKGFGFPIITSQLETGQQGRLQVQLSSAEMNWDDWEDVVKGDHALIEGNTSSERKDAARLPISEQIQASQGQSQSITKACVQSSGTDLVEAVSLKQGEFNQPSRSPSKGSNHKKQLNVQASLGYTQTGLKVNMLGNTSLQKLESTKGSLGEGIQRRSLSMNAILACEPGQSGRELSRKLSLAERNWEDWEDVVKENGYLSSQEKDSVMETQDVVEDEAWVKYPLVESKNIGDEITVELPVGEETTVELPVVQALSSYFGDNHLGTEKELEEEGGELPKHESQLAGTVGSLCERGGLSSSPPVSIQESEVPQNGLLSEKPDLMDSSLDSDEGRNVVSRTSVDSQHDPSAMNLSRAQRKWADWDDLKRSEGILFESGEFQTPRKTEGVRGLPSRSVEEIKSVHSDVSEEDDDVQYLRRPQRRAASSDETGDDGSSSGILQGALERSPSFQNDAAGLVSSRGVELVKPVPTTLRNEERGFSSLYSIVRTCRRSHQPRVKRKLESGNCIDKRPSPYVVSNNESFSYGGGRQDGKHELEGGEISTEDYNAISSSVQYDVAWILQQQTLFDLICPVCGSLVTNKIVVINLKRRFVRDGDAAAFRKVTELTPGILDSQEHQASQCYTSSDNDMDGEKWDRSCWACLQHFFGS